MGLFRGTAPYYARFRPQYPPELIARLAAAAGLDGGSRVLDLGSGPGHVAVPLSARVAEVVAVDPEPEMLEQIDAPNVRTVLGRAEDVDASWGRFDLVTAGRAFHWFDSGVMFERLPLVTSQLALVGDSILASEAQSLALDIAAGLLGEERPARRRDFYADVLAASPFPDVVELSVDVERTWTADGLIGLVYSTSLAPRLGGLRPELERRLRAQFGDRELRERGRVSALLGRRRRDA
jgi:SAM-dependent methyltransferase